MRQEFLRPHDIGVLLYLFFASKPTFREISRDVGLSLGESHNAVKRLELARLVSSIEARPNARGTLELLTHGVPWVFPGVPGTPVRGVPTGPELPTSDPVDRWVWPSAAGTARGMAVSPLVPAFVDQADRHPPLYRMLRNVDTLRIGRARDRAAAASWIESVLLGHGDAD